MWKQSSCRYILHEDSDCMCDVLTYYKLVHIVQYWHAVGKEEQPDFIFFYFLLMGRDAKYFTPFWHHNKV